MFESGAVSADASIDGQDTDRDSTTFEEHHDVIEREEQVQVYESVYVCDVQPGVTPRTAAWRNDFAVLDDPTIAARVIGRRSGSNVRATFSIPTVHCVLPDIHCVTNSPARRSA